MKKRVADDDDSVPQHHLCGVSVNPVDPLEDLDREGERLREVVREQRRQAELLEPPEPVRPPEHVEPLDGAQARVFPRLQPRIAPRLPEWDVGWRY